jgi:tetratricopeptide (TPR) repeat protein
LPEELARSRAQLRIEALRLHGGALPETLLSEAEAACSAHPTCARLHAELRELRARRGDWMGAFEAQQRVVANAAPASLSAEQETLCRDATTASARAIADGDVDAAKKLQRAIAKLPGPTAGLLQGDILAHKGDFRGAVRAWGQTASPEGLDRIAALLQNAPVAMDPRELLACCPMQGMVLLLARELARRGQADDALRAARHAAETLGPTTTVCLVLAETLDRLGQTERSQRLAEQAAQLLLQPTSPRESVPTQQQPPKLS